MDFRAQSDRTPDRMLDAIGRKWPPAATAKPLDINDVSPLQLAEVTFDPDGLRRWSRTSPPTSTTPTS
jgi:hypothetical protein